MNHAHVDISGSQHGSAPRSANEEFDQILYHITHDVRAALRALKSLPGWLREDLTENGAALSTSVVDILEMIEGQAELADRILLDLRTYSRIGRLKDEASTVPLGDALADAASRVGLPSRFVLNVNSAIPVVSAPRNECRVLMMAILSNCVKHHDQPEGRIDVSAMSNGNIMQIAIEDDGPGIPERFRDRVFEMMATLRSRDECPGSGLGLSIARKIVDSLGGTIRATDRMIGRGTRIEIDLPSKIVVAS